MNGRLHAPGKFSQWLFTIIANISRNFERNVARRLPGVQKFRSLNKWWLISGFHNKETHLENTLRNACAYGCERAVCYIGIVNE